MLLGIASNRGAKAVKSHTARAYPLEPSIKDSASWVREDATDVVRAEASVAMESTARTELPADTLEIITVEQLKTLKLPYLRLFMPGPKVATISQHSPLAAAAAMMHMAEGSVEGCTSVV